MQALRVCSAKLAEMQWDHTARTVVVALNPRKGRHRGERLQSSVA